jgi:hypothetical protein
MGEPDVYYSLRSYKMTRETYRELLRAEEDLHREFGKRSLREARFHRAEDLQKVSMVVASAPRGFVDGI